MKSTQPNVTPLFVPPGHQAVARPNCSTYKSRDDWLSLRKGNLLTVAKLVQERYVRCEVNPAVLARNPIWPVRPSTVAQFGIWNQLSIGLPQRKPVLDSVLFERTRESALSNSRAILHHGPCLISTTTSAQGFARVFESGLYSSCHAVNFQPHHCKKAHLQTMT